MSNNHMPHISKKHQLAKEHRKKRQSPLFSMIGTRLNLDSDEKFAGSEVFKSSGILTGINFATTCGGKPKYPSQLFAGTLLLPIEFQLQISIDEAVNVAIHDRLDISGLKISAMIFDH